MAGGDKAAERGKNILFFLEKALDNSRGLCYLKSMVSQC